MSLQLSGKEIELIVNEIRYYKEVEQALLFGSRATGKAKPYSDVDICIKGSQVTLQIQNAIALKLDDLPLPYFFDVITFHNIKNEKLTQHILNHSIDLLQYTGVSQPL